ncbi:MAG: IspD/TarI family cytidylyltransferase, partial [Chthoniobacterales bacterium]
MLTAIIVAGGSSQRMGFDKTLALLGGKPVLAHSIIAFERTAAVSEIILVGRTENLPALEEIVRTGEFRKVAAVIAGGARRQDSVRAGLAQLSQKSEFVAVHDAARPLVTPELIECIFARARQHGGAVSAAPVTDTLKRVSREHFVTGGVDRADLFAVQTPQIFARALLEKAYAALLADNVEVTDGISAVERGGG